MPVCVGCGRLIVRNNEKLLRKLASASMPIDADGVFGVGTGSRWLDLPRQRIYRVLMRSNTVPTAMVGQVRGSRIPFDGLADVVAR